jgi:hypothetical protein
MGATIIVLENDQTQDIMLQLKSLRISLDLVRYSKLGNNYIIGKNNTNRCEQLGQGPD